ncbi:MAG TPA: tripartite tricarboxylate transporter substrate binding protein [Burkholderiales bacterium]|nr:tripartite tricarboxylate transporter substrate binding protein [Burkholderiales bacterium]
MHALRIDMSAAHFRPPAVLLALLLTATTTTLYAQSYPTRAVRMIVPFAPGGNTDIIGRVYAPKMAEALGQQLIIDNRGGAGSTIGTELAAKAAPDGYTILMVSAAHTINPAMAKKLPYDSVRDFAPVGIVADVPTALVVHPSLPTKNVKEFIAVARGRPGEIFYSTAGRGTVGHLASELLNSVAQIKITAVHYKGTGPSMIDLVAGHVQMQFPSMPAAVQYTRPGKLRMIAQTGEKRSSAAPEVPTMQEQGLKSFVVSSGFAMFAPAGTPKPIIDRLNGALVKALNDPGVKNNLTQQGAEVVASSPEAHDKFNRAEIAKWIKVAREAGIQPE